MQSLNPRSEKHRTSPAPKKAANKNSGKQKTKETSVKKAKDRNAQPEKSSRKRKLSKSNKDVVSEALSASAAEKTAIAQEVRADNMYDTLADTQSEYAREIWKTAKQQKGLADIFNAFSASSDSGTNHDVANSIINQEKNESNSNFVI